MQCIQTTGWTSARIARGVVLLFGFGLAFGVSGCGTPGAPQPPSLKLPEPVTDLTAFRNGGAVTLHWTMPKRTTDRLLLSTQIHGAIPVSVCRREVAAGACQAAGEVSFPPIAEGEFRDTLPPALVTGDPRRLAYFIELKNKSGPGGRSAGPSNLAVVLAGAAPQPVTSLAAEVHADGVVLHWGDRGTSTTAAMRFHRRLLNPPTPKPKATPGQASNLAAPEPIERDLLLEPHGEANGAVDQSVRFGNSYEYTAQAVDRIVIDGKTLELAGEVSAPVRVDVVDTFPPAIPRGLVAVLVPEQKIVDLSWQPDTEEDLAGYVVYRSREDEHGNWTRISGEQPVATPAYQDSKVEAGHMYSYAISAIDLTGHESSRSASAQESVPNP